MHTYFTIFLFKDERRIQVPPGMPEPVPPLPPPRERDASVVVGEGHDHPYARALASGHHEVFTLKHSRAKALLFSSDCGVLDSNKRKPSLLITLELSTLGTSD